MDSLYHYLQIVVLGIVEGVTEFLPISSTGHLLIAEHWMGTQEPDIFNVVIQAGAILAVVFIYWHKIVALFSNLDQPESRNYLLKIGAAFLVTTILVLLLTVKLKLKLPETLTPVAWATFIGGLVIFGIEFFAKNLYAHEDVSWFEAALVGAGQVIAAVFPGASRSGSTIMAGLAVGMKRPTVTQFSFMVGIPTMFAASAYDTFKSYKNHELSGLGHQIIIDTAIGFVISLIVAFFVVKWLLVFVQSHTFNGFAIYRVILGGALLIGLYTHAIPDVSNEDKPAASAEAPAAPAINGATSGSGTMPGFSETNYGGAVAPAVVSPIYSGTTTITSGPDSVSSTPTSASAPAVTPLAPATDAAPVAPIPPATNSAPVSPVTGAP